VCQTQQFFQYAIVSDSVIDPTHHPCLHSLPSIFLKAMQGISAMVDAYLGLCRVLHLGKSPWSWAVPEYHIL
jgi:hypothetical protein